jgi:hypothetical protein
VQLHLLQLVGLHLRPHFREQGLGGGNICIYTYIVYIYICMCVHVCIIIYIYVCIYIDFVLSCTCKGILSNNYLEGFSYNLSRVGQGWLAFRAPPSSCTTFHGRVPSASTKPKFPGLRLRQQRSENQAKKTKLRRPSQETTAK